MPRPLLWRCPACGAALGVVERGDLRAVRPEEVTITGAGTWVRCCCGATRLWRSRAPSAAAS